MAATAPGDYADLARDRWDTITISVDIYDAQEIASELLTVWMDSTRKILGRMIHGAETPDEYQMLGTAESRLLHILSDAATDLAEAVETSRAAGRKVAAA
jgi:hypothetical protein